MSLYIALEAKEFAVLLTVKTWSPQISLTKRTSRKISFLGIRGGQGLHRLYLEYHHSSDVLIYHNMLSTPSLFALTIPEAQSLRWIPASCCSHHHFPCRLWGLGQRREDYAKNGQVLRPQQVPNCSMPDTTLTGPPFRQSLQVYRSASWRLPCSRLEPSLSAEKPFPSPGFVIRGYWCPVSWNTYAVSW